MVTQIRHTVSMDADVTVTVNVTEETERSQPHGEGENTTFQPERTDIEVRAVIVCQEYLTERKKLV